MKTLFLFLALALPGWGEITVDATASGVTQTAVGFTGQTWSHTVGTCDHRALFVVVTGISGDGTNPQVLSSVKVAGVSNSFVRRAGGNWTLEIWEMVNPPSGAFNVVVVVAPPASTDSFDAMIYRSISFCGVNPDTPTVLNSVDAFNSNTNALTTSVTSTVAGTALLAAAVANNGDLTLANGQTEIASNIQAGAVSTSIGYKLNVGVGANTIGWTRSGGVADHGTVAIAIKPFTGNPTSSGIHTTAYVPAPRPRATDILNTGNGTGDTQMCAWTSATTLAGPWNGGAIPCTYNDGIGLGCVSRNICLWKLLTYVPGTSMTTGLVNDFASYGGASADSCYDAIHQMKSRKPFSLPGYLFVPIFCMSDGPPFDAFQSGFVISGDGGVHLNNLKTFSANGNAFNVAVGATGDNPVDAAGYAWPLADGTSKMTRMMLVDFMCQDNTVNCPVAPGVDPAYLYFIMLPSSNTSLEFYVARVLKSLGPLIMLPANWEVVTNTTGPVWSAATQINAVDVSGGVVQSAGSLAASSWSYLKDFGVFVMMNQSNGTLSTTAGFATAPTPWGPWTKAPDFVTGQATILGFPGPVAGLCPKYSGGRIGCTVIGNGASNTDTVLTEFDLGPQGPTWSAGTWEPLHWRFLRDGLFQ
jgi:hypothetical protein